MNGIIIPRPSGHDTEFGRILRCSSAASGRLGVCLGLQRRASLDKEFIAFIGVNGIIIFGTRSSYFSGFLLYSIVWTEDSASLVHVQKEQHGSMIGVLEVIAALPPSPRNSSSIPEDAPAQSNWHS